MDQQRKGEIALKVVGFLLRHRGLEISKQSEREWGSVAKELGISIEELKEFTQPIIQEYLDEFFAPKK